MKNWKSNDVVTSQYEILTDIYMFYNICYIYMLYNSRLRRGIWTTDCMSENVVWPGIEPGSPDY